MKKALVCGAGGFVGGHLVKRLKGEGFWVRGVDQKKAPALHRCFPGRLCRNQVLIVSVIDGSSASRVCRMMPSL
jgi:nucleoside-diphosphate-sugar epimerase